MIGSQLEALWAYVGRAFTPREAGRKGPPYDSGGARWQYM